MNVTLLSTVYYPDPTGTSVYATAVGERLASQGHSVQVVTTVPHYPQWEIRPEYKGKLRATDHRNGVRIDRLWLYVPKDQSVMTRGVYEASFLAHALLRPRLRAHKPDLVLAFMPNVGNGVAGAWWARRAKAPLVVFVQDISSTGAKESGVEGGGRVAGLVSRVEAGVANAAAVVTVCDPSFRTTLEASGVPAEKIVPFPNWTRLAEPDGDRQAERVRRGWSPDERVILHAGNLGLKQRMDLVVDYAAEARRRGSKLRFVMVGDGSQRHEIERKSAGMDNVEFIPPVEEAELPNLLAAADILFLHERPGLREMSVPSKLTAYFSVARPVVAAVEREGPAAQLVLNSGGGFVTPAGDPASLVNVLVDLAGDEARMTSLGAAGRSFAEREMSPEAAMARLDAIVARALRS